ncbi:hypothetical protein [Sorangium sp. So ce1153]|uniref:hypothetical protein n=1 Tax=Sorangium sp. So ce1153 TaxID=3133333 RepID=UPI003F5F9CC8
MSFSSRPPAFMFKSDHHRRAGRRRTAARWELRVRAPRAGPLALAGARAPPPPGPRLDRAEKALPVARKAGTVPPR